MQAVKTCNTFSTCSSVMTSGGLILITLRRCGIISVVSGMSTSKMTPSFLPISTKATARSIAGLLLARSSTNSTPMNSPAPRTSPIISYFCWRSFR